MLQVCPFPCGCVCELWIMFIHLMDHLSTKTELEVWETDYGYVPLRWSGSGSVIQDHSDHGTSKEPMNPWPEWIRRFLWCTMIRVILDHWSGSPQRNAPYVYYMKDNNQGKKPSQFQSEDYLSLWVNPIVKVLDGSLTSALLKLQTLFIVPFFSKYAGIDANCIIRLWQFPS